MAVNPTTLAEKLSKLSTTQQSIETLSQWCIFYKKDAEQIVTLWEAEFSRSKDVEKMLALIYLANDILQNSRKKGPQFVNEFYAKLPPAMHKLTKIGGPEVSRKLAKIVKVWDDRRVFGSSGVKPFMDILGHLNVVPAEPPTAAPTTTGRKRGNIVLQTSDPSVTSLSNSIQEAEQAYFRCQTLLPQTAAALRTDSSQGGAETLSSSIKSLTIQITALENEIGHRDRVIGILSSLLGQQKEKKDTAEALWASHKAELEERHHRSSQNARGTQNGNHVDMNHASPQAQAIQPSESPPNQNDPRLAQASDARQSEEVSPPPEAETSQSRDPRSQSAEETSLSQVLGGFADGMSPGSGKQAADLVAQLSHSGMSAQMLIEALSSLPSKGPEQPTQREGEEEEEYDPELGE